MNYRAIGGVLEYFFMCNREYLSPDFWHFKPQKVVKGGVLSLFFGTKLHRQLHRQLHRYL